MDASTFLAELHAPSIEEGRFFSIWAKSRKGETRFFRQPEEAAEYAKRVRDDVYVGMGTLDAVPESGRGSAADVAAIDGLWIDLDYGKHDGPKVYPPKDDDAMEVLQAMGAAPSLLVRTGGGFHGHWLFNEPVPAAEGAVLARRWVATAQAHARQRGWTVDSVGDLARVLRIPQTVNVRVGVLVDVVDAPVIRYNPDDLEPLMVDDPGEQTTTTTRGAGLVLNRGASAPHAARLALADAGFRKTWERRRTDFVDGSASSYDMAVASTGVWQGWTDQQIADAIIAWRELHEERPEKAQRVDYISRTIGKARDQKDTDDALEALESGEIEADDVRAALAQITGLPIERWIQRGHEAGQECFYLKLAGREKEIPIGSATVVLSYGGFRAAVYAETGIRLKVSAKKWGIVCDHLGTIREVEEIEEDTEIGRVSRYMLAYLDANGVDEVERQGDIEGDGPAIWKGEYLVYVADFETWLASSRLRVTHIYRALRRVGWRQRTIARKGTSQSRWALSRSAPQMGVGTKTSDLHQ